MIQLTRAPRPPAARRRAAIFLSVALLAAACTSLRPARATGPWDVPALRQAPEATWGATNGLVQEVYYAGEPFQGKPTRVFAYYGRPAGPGPFPAVLLVHGGGGKAFADWANHWAQRGYVALAMDLAGCGTAGRLPDGGPDQSDNTKFRDFTEADIRDMWTYHAIADVLRGRGLLASRPEVDADRIAVTGISWGGYLTCIVAGLDHQLKAAVPVYGCGFLDEDSYWVGPQFSKMTAERRQRWVEHFDPSRYLCGARCPMLFLDGTCDFAYPMNSLQKSYQLVKAPLTLSVQINRAHGHYWTFGEVDAFIDSVVRDGPPLLRLGRLTVRDDRATAPLLTAAPGAQAELNYTTDTGPWSKRVWKTAPAEIRDGQVTADLPTRGPLTYYLRVIDSRGLAVSTPHAEQHPEATR